MLFAFVDTAVRADSNFHIAMLLARTESILENPEPQDFDLGKGST